MEGIFERRAVELSWNEVCNVVLGEIDDILGFRVQGKVTIAAEDSYWDVIFIDYRLPLPKLCQLLQATQAAPEDWEDELPNDGRIDVGDIGMVLAEKLIARHLKLTWEHHLITADSLWLVGVTKDTPHLCQ